mmetsp:Transcript_18330/g.2533  ORF Transcript_18330/g.2533 Transcript_18330/m.2533 type:complete len:108 (+) Transcript_18330:65-388(+)
MNKWVLQMYLAGAQRLKLAYVSRHAKALENSQRHQILKVVDYTYEEMKQELKVKPEECWNIVKFIVNFMKAQKDGKYLLYKLSYKSQVKIYYVPENDDDNENEYYEG